MDDGVGGGFFVALVFEYFGALCKWIYYTIKAGIVGDSAPTFVGFIVFMVLVFVSVLIVNQG